MGFGDLMSDTISILKRDGKKYEKVPASVQASGIYISNAAKMLIEQGDLAFRQMSNGGEEYFEILDPGYHEAIGGVVPPHYQMNVRKLSAADARQLLLNAQNENTNQTSTTSDAPKKAKYAEWGRMGLDRVKSDLMMTGGMREIGGTLENRELAWQWVREQEAALQAAKAATQVSDSAHIADNRLEELRALKSADFDFTKLIRLCEEINWAYANGSYFSVAMLTRAILDHVPPLFQVRSFSEVANNYAGGGRSFKETMQHLENAARKIGDSHLHIQIRNKEVLPVAQQVNCAQQLDMLLAEIVRLYK